MCTFLALDAGAPLGAGDPTHILEYPAARGTPCCPAGRATPLHGSTSHEAAGGGPVRVCHRQRRRVRRGRARGFVSSTVDASAVTFVDAGGLGALVRLRNTIAPFGRTVTVIAASPRFRQVADLAGLAEPFGLDLLPDPVPSRTGSCLVTIGPNRSRAASRRLSAGQPRSGDVPTTHTAPAR
jgi:ABC-type transporter Mla MlaB component